jgi:hypothetical protein
MADRPFNLGIDPADAQARLQQLLQPTQYAEGGPVPSLRERLLSMLKGDDYQSTGEKVVNDGEVNWGSPDSAADFFRADKARMEMERKLRENESRPAPSTAVESRPLPPPPRRQVEPEVPPAQRTIPGAQPPLPSGGFMPMRPNRPSEASVQPVAYDSNESPEALRAMASRYAAEEKPEALRAIEDATAQLNIRDISHMAQYRGSAMEEPEAVVFHHTAGRGTPEGVVNTLNNRVDPFTGRKMILGVHYIIDRDGSVHAALPPGTTGAHVLTNQERNLGNQNTIGVEVIAKNNDDVTPEQVAAGKLLHAYLSSGRKKPLEVFGHGELNPGHKLPNEGLAIVNPIRNRLKIDSARGYARGGLKEAIAAMEGPEAQGASSPSFEGMGEALSGIGAGISDIYSTPQADLSAYMRAPEVSARRAITPSMLGAALSPEAQGASSPSLEGVGEVMHSMGEDPVALIGGMLPGIGNALAAADVAKLKDKIDVLRTAGADEEANKLQRFLPLAAAGVVMPAGGGLASRAALKGAEKAALRGAEEAALRGAGPELRASTRFPTGKSATENPLLEQLTIGPKEMRETPTFEHNMGLLSDYPGFAHLKGRSPEEQLSGYMDQARDNLNFLYENAPSVMRERSPSWYNGANNFSDALSERYGIPRQSSSAAIAALSPQMDWFKNASLAERVGDVIFGPTASTRMTPEMESFQRNSTALTSPVNQAVFDSIAGKRFSDLTDPLDQALWIRLYDEVHNARNYRSITPEGKLGHFITNDDGSVAKVGWGSLNEIEKAVRAYTSGGDMNVISPMLGTKHKVRSFYNNIELPDDLRFGDVTADTHAVAASQLRPLSGNTPAVAHNLASGLAKKKQPPNYVAEKSSAVTGVQGTYGANAEATRMAAADQGLLPRQMQSATWEPVRELFPREWKTPKNVEAVDNIWREKDAGNLTAEQARNAIFELAGGFREPTWAQRGPAPVDPRRGSTYR